MQNLQLLPFDTSRYPLQWTLNLDKKFSQLHYFTELQSAKVIFHFKKITNYNNLYFLMKFMWS